MPRTYVDRGGTFTDVVVVDDAGGASLRKVPSDRAVVGELAEGPLTFGTTVATNALLEGRGARVLLWVTAGFGDLVRIGDMARPQLFDPDARWPEPLTARVMEVKGRLDAEGREVEPLAVPQVDASDLADIDAIAVVLLHAHRNDAHERAAAEALAGWGKRVVLGSALVPETGYLARIETTLIEAALAPALSEALRRDQIPVDALAVRSDGSLCPAIDLRACDAVLSGPASGVAAAAAVARLAGFEAAVGLDMGGTSTDVCLVRAEDLPRRDSEVRVAGRRLRRPILEVETIAAGGGSILANDGLCLRVGPASAGAAPGPQCTGRGGPPTLTDAALRLGRMDPSAFEPRLRPELVNLPGAAEAFVDVATEAMAAALRRLAGQHGADLREHALVAFGGAAGQYAAEIADKVGCPAVLVHPAASVLCAWGQAGLRREETASRALWTPLEAALPALPQVAKELAGSLPDWGPPRFNLGLRPLGADAALAVPYAPGESEASLDAAHAKAWQALYGFERGDVALEAVQLVGRVRAPVPAASPALPDPFGLPPEGMLGPTRLDCPTTSVWVPEGWRADRGPANILILRRAAPPVREAATVRTPAGVALWSSRFMSVAEQAGARLQRLARSVSIRERLDFSVAVFDAQGGLVANAPHVPVHLGAMGETVRDLLAAVPEPEDGDAWLTNDPAAGGSHLPDLTVITAVVHQGHRFFVASRGHHVDVGGLTPGSMPPHSRTLAEEGLVFRRWPLQRSGRLNLPDLTGSRQPEVVAADLSAQLAANHEGARLLRGLGPGATLTAWMAHLQDVAAEAVARLIARLPAGEAEDTLDGLPLRLRLHVEAGVLTLDFTGTAGPNPGNLNAPRGVVRAAALYALRVLAAEPLPLNEGALRRVRLILPPGSVVDPPPGAAVAGGNVETSQRLVDLILMAAGARAASQGTMNNLTLGGPGWAFYETLGGGVGASASEPGASATQVHMTNTRATDPEVLESRLPLRVCRFSLRSGSGGEGANRGGDGLVRELELLTDGEASLLAAWRPDGAPGLSGGRAGAVGFAEVRRGGVWTAWDGARVALSAGDRVRVGTPGGGGYGISTVSAG